CGLSRPCAAQFTFFLAIPVMAGASLLKLVKFFAKGNAFAFNEDRKSTRLNSSHVSISYAVFCLKKKKTKIGQVTGGAMTTIEQPQPKSGCQTLAHRTSEAPARTRAAERVDGVAMRTTAQKKRT